MEELFEAKEPPKKKKKKSGKVLLIVLGSILIVLGVAAFFGYRYVNRILKQPETMFDYETETPIPEKTPMAPAFEISVEVQGREDAFAEASDPFGIDQQTTEQPERSEETPAESDGIAYNGILNIMLTGIDAYEDGRTTSGTMPHTDSMMVIAVNFDQDTVDIITLPRDTFTTVPGHSGFYKLNGVFNVGLNGKFSTTGQSDDLADGFKLVCRTAEKWLGGISIPYYYGVDFQAVIDIVDAIGGIDYEVDQQFWSMSRRRSYHVGMQHLDGDAVMGYLRIRNSADGLDSSRTARQRKMMVAIFKKLKKEGKLSQIPTLISAADSGIYTNTSLGQTAALVNYAANLDSDNIRTRAMYGDIGEIEAYWRFAYVNQQNRLDIIREVYGIEAKPVGFCTRQYERWLTRIGFSTIKYLHQVEKVLQTVQEKKDAGESFTDEQIALYAACYNDYIALHDAYDTEFAALAAEYAAAPWREKKNEQKTLTTEQTQKNIELSNRETELYAYLQDLMKDLRKSTEDLAQSINYRKLSWQVANRWFEDSDINEVFVNFG
jgi:LCP family protein required for cell wall assembly